MAHMAPEPETADTATPAEHEGPFETGEVPPEPELADSRGTTGSDPTSAAEMVSEPELTD